MLVITASALPTEVLTGIADQVGGLLWAPRASEQDDDNGTVGAPISAA
jgi:hypothetical protein